MDNGTKVYALYYTQRVDLAGNCTETEMFSHYTESERTARCWAGGEGQFFEVEYLSPQDHVDACEEGILKY